MTSGDSVLKQGQLKNDFNKCLKSWVGSLRVVDMLRFVSPIYTRKCRMITHQRLTMRVGERDNHLNKSPILWYRIQVVD